jgi:hypothetical protein
MLNTAEYFRATNKIKVNVDHLGGLAGARVLPGGQ